METKNKGYEMSSFIKIAIRNLLKGPTTDPYPFGETFIPENLRGKLKVDANACTACGTCEEVCPSGAIHITNNDNIYVHTTWYNSCCYCGNCEFFCPTGAIKLTNDFHTANSEKEKYKFINVATIAKVKCEKCSEYFMARETVRSLSAVGVGRLRRADPSTRGPGWTCHWCTSCPAKGSAG